MSATAGLITAGLPVKRARAAAAYLALGVVAASGVAIAVRISANHLPLVPGAGRRPPDWIAGPLAELGAPRLSGSGFYLLVVAMALAYLAAVLLRGELRARWIVSVVVFLHLAFLLAPPVLSRDVWLYIDVARLASVHGIDPYTHGPAAAPSDPAFLHTSWRHSASAYGPLFTVASYPLGRVSLAAALWSFKALAALGSLVCARLVWVIARRRGRLPASAVAVYGLNPILLVWTVGGAHNDILMLALLLAGIWLVLIAREALGGVVLLAGAAIKATAGVALPFVLIAARRRWRLLAVIGGSAAVIYVLAALAIPGSPLDFIHALGRQGELSTYHSVPRTVAGLFGLSSVTDEVRTSADVVAVAALVAIAFRVWRGADWIEACGWGMAVLAATATHFLPWYAVWPLALAAVARGNRLLLATLALQGFFIVAHMSDLAT
jgi:Glycosyltransferase family 87